VSRSYTINLSPSGWDAALYVITAACDPSMCLDGDDATPPASDSVTLALTAGQTYYIIVDAAQMTGGVGSYSLTVQ
jgi:hypothetical protein